MRHGETEWSAAGAHTSRTDLPLLPSGIRQAQELAAKLNGRKFALVLVSPMQRARETCRIAGYGDVAEVTDDLKEWDYGVYEGRSTADIRKGNPAWSLWRDGVSKENLWSMLEHEYNVSSIVAPNSMVMSHSLPTVTCCVFSQQCGSGYYQAMVNFLCLVLAQSVSSGTSTSIV